MIKWPPSARAALAFLFRPLQDIDVYVEDVGDEVFYSELFKRIAPNNIRIARVFTLGNRYTVIERARLHDFGARAALYVVDGDFEWVRDEPPPSIPGVYRLDAYCIENLLIQEEPAVQVIIEDAAATEESARATLAFGEWLDDISRPLIDLFVSFAALNTISPDEPTVGIGISKVLSTGTRGRLPNLDLSKVDRLRHEIDLKAERIAGSTKAEEIRNSIRQRVDRLSASVDVVSGKDFLMPLFEFRLWGCIPTKTRRTSLRIRLARHCMIIRFAGLRDALKRSLSNN